MAKKETAVAKRNPMTLEISQHSNETIEQAVARVATNSVVRGAATGRQYAHPMFGSDLELSAYTEQLQKQAEAVNGGDMKGVETMLLTQANTLDMIFNQLARKSALCDYMPQMEANLRLALKAQSQCRTTLEALAEIKNPRSVAFVRQANIANGPQQVNNGQPAPRAPEESKDLSNQLLEHQHGEWMDAGAKSAARRGDQALEAVGEIDRPENR